MAIIPGTAKVLNQYENVNTTYGGSKAMKAQSKWYTMDDVLETVEANIPGGGVTEIIAGDGISVDQSTGAVTVSSTVTPYVAPYTVFTALVSQTGGNNPVNIGEGAPVLLGVTYYITDNSNAVDLTVFGAPNSNIGTYFICTTAGTLPNDPGILLQYNDGAPVVTILENTIGNIWLQYIDAGRYIIQSDSLFTDSKTFINGAKIGTDYAVFNPFIEPSAASPANDRGYSLVIETGAGENIIQLNTLKGVGSYDNGVIENPICIEIRVYN